MSVTMQEIASLAGVSRGTVDRALHDRGRIDPEVKKSILEIADSLGYSPCRKTSARTYAYRIGVITFLSERAFADELNHGIQQAKKELELLDIEVLIRKCPDISEASELQAIDELLREGISALAIMPVDSSLIRSRLNEVTEHFHIPVVTFNADIVGTHRLCFVGMDNARSGRTAAGLMAMLTGGSGNILVLTGSFSNNAYSNRVDGFVQEIKTSYPSMKIIGVQCTFDDEKEIESILQAAFLGNQNIAGILVTSAHQEGVENAFRKLNIEKAPHVIFYDRTACTEEALMHGNGDFIIEQDCYSQGYQAAHILANYLLKQQTPDEEYLYTDIVIKTKYNL